MEFPDLTEAEPAPSDNLFVSDLPPGTTEDTIRKMFGPGVVQCKVLPSKTSGGSTVAMVKFSSTKEAVLVRETLNGAIPPDQTRPVTIRFCGSRPDSAKLESGGAGAAAAPVYAKAAVLAAANASRQSPYGGPSKAVGGTPSQGNPPNDNLYVTGLPPGIDNAALLGLFSQYGQVVQCKVLPSPNEGLRPHALVRFSSVEEATSVKKALTGYALEGVEEPLLIEYAIQRSRPEASTGGWSGKGYPPSGGYDWSGGYPGKGYADTGKGYAETYKGGPPYKGGGGGGKGGGKSDRSQFTPPWGGMDKILQGFHEAQCLPGHTLGNEDNCLFVAGLPKDCDDVHLYRLMAPFGAITPTGVKAMKFPDGTCKGFGFVNFVDPESLQAAALMLHGTQLPDGTSMSVVPKRAKKGGKGGPGPADMPGKP